MGIGLFVGLLEVQGLCDTGEEGVGGLKAPTDTRGETSQIGGYRDGGTSASTDRTDRAFPCLEVPAALADDVAACGEHGGWTLPQEDPAQVAAERGHRERGGVVSCPTSSSLNAQDTSPLGPS